MKLRMFLLAFLTCSLSFVMAQRTVTGTVTDDLGEPLIGATIQVDGFDGLGAVTDFDGTYSIDVPDGGTTLLFSYTGFADLEIALGASNVVNVSMAEDAEILGEIIVIGYGSDAIREQVSSVASVNAEKIGNTAFTDINQVLQGQAAGVYTTANSGQPGAGQQIRIRGTGSISAGRNPLYVIDGIIVESGNSSQLDGAANATDILAQLNPNDIANISVLKDASATSLYGARGSNGVVVITTKRGKEGKTVFTVKTQYGTTEPNIGNFEMMTAEQQWEYERKMLANSGFDQATIDSRRPLDMLEETTDWVEAAFRNGDTYNLELQASGGTQNTQFFVSGGHFSQEGTLIESEFDRTSLRSNINHRANDKLSFALNFNGSYSQNGNAVNGNRFQSPLLGAFLNTPLQSAYDEDGELLTGLESDWIPFIGDNFLYSQPLNYVDINTIRILSKLEASYKILPNLKITQSGSIDFIDIEETDFDDLTTNDGVNDAGGLINSFANDRTLTSQTLLKYIEDFGAHSVTALGGFEYQRYARKAFSANGIGFASGQLQTLNSAATPQSLGGSKTNYSFVSFLGQVNYAYQSRYNLTASIRRDGSSRFGANNRYATFWSLGASWNVTDEPFLQNRPSVIDLLRLRASYGTNGNADIGNFLSQELYGFGAAYDGIPGSAPSQIANPDLTWETSDALNVGLDFGLFEGSRITGSVEYYIKNSKDLLLAVPVSATSGFTTATRNIGEIQNSGIELVLSGSPVRSLAGFNWDVDFNISWNDNEVISLPDGEDIINGTQIIREGLPIRSVYLRQWAGVNPADGTPLWRIEEGGVTGTYNQADRIVSGNAEPDFIAGMTNKFSYKGIGLSAFFYTAQGHKIFNSSRRFIESDGQRYGWNHLAYAADHWENPGDISSRPQPRVGGNNGANSSSTRYLEDASYIRLRNVTLSYQLPRTLLDRIGVSNIGVYVQGNNLITITDYTGFDPEADENGSEFFRYPVGKSYTFGIDFTF